MVFVVVDGSGRRHGAVACAAHAAPRIVSIGGPVTEIVYALGAGDQVVGVDTSSTFPEAATRLPQVGYQRRLSAEGVLSLQPDVVLATSDAGPPAALEQLKAVVELVEVPAVYTIAGAEAKIRLIAQTSSAAKRRANGCWTTLRRDLAAAQAVVERAAPGRGCCSCTRAAWAPCSYRGPAPPPTP